MPVARVCSTSNGSVRGSTPRVRDEERLPLAIHTPNHGPVRKASSTSSWLARRSSSQRLRARKPRRLAFSVSTEIVEVAMAQGFQFELMPGGALRGAADGASGTMGAAGVAGATTVSVAERPAVGPSKPRTGISTCSPISEPPWRAFSSQPLR